MDEKGSLTWFDQVYYGFWFELLIEKGSLTWFDQVYYGLHGTLCFCVCVHQGEIAAEISKERSLKADLRSDQERRLDSPNR